MYIYIYIYVITYIVYPTSSKYVHLFEMHNELCINIYIINDTNNIINHHLGNINYYGV